MQESEALELAALKDLHAAAPPAAAEKLGLQHFDLATTFVSMAARLPASAIIINRALGLGLDGDTTQKETAALHQLYQRAGVARYFVQLHPLARPARCAEWLEAQGLQKTRGWQKFSRGREAVAEKPTGLNVRKVGPEYGEDYGRIVCEGFDLGEQAVPWLAQLPDREGWHIFMSFDGDQPAGGGALFVRDNLAWLDLAATDPAFRRRGSQSAVMAARLKLALELGCERMYTCTGVAVPGDPQHSYNNILKAGFKEDYIRANYAPPKT